MLQHLVESLPGTPSNLETGNAQIQGIVEKKGLELVGDPTPPLRPIFGGEWYPVRLLDRHEHHEIEALHRSPNARHPGFDIESVPVRVGREIGEEVRRTTVEDLVGGPLQEGLNRSLQLELEIPEGGRIVKRVTFFLQGAVGLLDRHVSRQTATHVFDEGGLAGAVRTGNRDPHRLDAYGNGLL